MENKEKLVSALQELRADNSKKQKNGIHFILASVIIWIAVLLIHISPLPILTKNLYTFFCSAPLVPLAYFISKFIGVDFQNKGNPFSNLGLLISLNQMLYILIAMWVYAVVPDKMLMVYAMIFGAHLLPYGWLYNSKVYYVFSVAIPIAVLVVGLYFSPLAVAVLMLTVETIFSVCLIFEYKAKQKKHKTP